MTTPDTSGTGPGRGEIVDVATWKWFGAAGHLIVGRWCRFHLCTQVGSWLVSTVGEYWPERPTREIHAEVVDPEWLFLNAHRKGDDFDAAYMERFGYDTIGLGRLYETMVFRAGEPCSSEGCGCGMPSIDGQEQDFEGYNDAAAATRGHYEMCKRWAARAALQEQTR